MAPRPQWKGYLKLSLVSCAVALYPAVASSVRTHFHTLNRKTGQRVKRQYIDAASGQVVEPEDQVRGYEVAKDPFVLVEDEELDAVALESTHTIDIDRFVKRADVDERYLDRPYYLAPDDAIAQQAFAVIRGAMQQKGVVGLARVVLQRREQLIMLEPFGQGMLATTLRFSYELRDEKPYFEDIEKVETPKEMVDLATHIIESKAGRFNVAEFEDRYEKGLVALIHEKQKGQPIRAAQPERPSNVVNLMEALRRSVATSGNDNRPAREPQRKPTSHARAKPKHGGAATKPRGRGGRIKKAS